jgi:hypothetical protein
VGEQRDIAENLPNSLGCGGSAASWPSSLADTIFCPLEVDDLWQPKRSIAKNLPFGREFDIGVGAGGV